MNIWGKLTYFKQSCFSKGRLFERSLNIDCGLWQSVDTHMSRYMKAFSVHRERCIDVVGQIINGAPFCSTPAKHSCNNQHLKCEGQGESIFVFHWVQSFRQEKVQNWWSHLWFNFKISKLLWLKKKQLSLSLSVDRRIQMPAEVEKKLQSFLEFRE